MERRMEGKRRRYFFLLLLSPRLFEMLQKITGSGDEGMHSWKAREEEKKENK